MDLEAMIKAPLRDADWAKKCLLIGLFALIPIAGFLNLMGWMKDIYRRVKAGDTTLPPPSLDYIGSGWSLFVALLPIAVFPICIAFAGAGLAIAHQPRLLPLLQAINIPISLFLNVVFVPTLVYRHVVHGSGFGGAFDFGAIKRTWMTNPGNFLTFAVVYFCASMIGSLGMIACCVGIFFTLPFSLAIHANVIKGFEDVSGGI